MWQATIFLYTIVLGVVYAQIPEDIDGSMQRLVEAPPATPRVVLLEQQPLQRRNTIQAEIKREMKTEFEKVKNDIGHIFGVQRNLSNSVSSAVQTLVKLEQRLSHLINLNVNRSLCHQETTTKPTVVTIVKAIQFDIYLECVGNCGAVEELPQDCAAALENSQQEDGVYLLKPRAIPEPFGAYCQRDEGNAWTLILRRENGDVDFKRTWNDYKRGFGRLHGDYWLGLERIHALTARDSYELWVYMESFNGTINFARYSPFTVASEAEGYKLKVGWYDGNVKDMLEYGNGQKFSTFDSGAHSNCASDFGAWWYDVCDGPSPMGIYQNESDGKEIHWQRDNPLQYIHMAIHRISFTYV